MKLLRYGQKGEEMPGLMDAQGQIRDLSSIVDDITPDVLSPTMLARLSSLNIASLPVVEQPIRLGTPWTGISKFVAVGLNYHDHALEAGLQVPLEPVLFPKWVTCLCGANDDIIRPRGSERLDWEVELGIVIGSTARHVSEDEALRYVAGYCLTNDVSERTYQFERGGGQWGVGKGFDSFGPVGPFLVSSDDVPDPQKLDIWLDVNGERKQFSSTSQMIFSCKQIVSYCSQVMRLEAGDLIITGTPPGVGMGFKPPQFLRDGDIVELGISGLGQQRHLVVPN
jgi:2-keto-4-pentenoate hydratase/2-oxohepta-3-ene-1,7-dioic acid hydratase in catechol pathway